MHTYSALSPRTTIYADRRLLERAKMNNILGQFGQTRQLPSKSSKTIVFRRYNKLAAATVPLTEGVTPSGNTVTPTDVTVSIQQFGDFLKYTDVIEDTHEDPILQEFTDILGDQAAETWDILRAGVLSAGTNVVYMNGTARTDVNTVITHAKIRSIVRILKAQEAKVLRDVINAGPNISTSPIAAAFIAVCHSNLQPDLEAITAWVPVSEYASTRGIIQGEAGAIGEIRFVFDNNLTPWADGGGLAVTNSTLSTTGTKSDVYPVLVFGKDAYGVVQLAGKNSVQTLVNNPKATDGDELAQRGSIGWKGYTASVILNDLWMVRLEVAAKG